MRLHSSGWYLSLSSYWFASSLKWFAVLLVVLPGRVAEVAPDNSVAALALLFAVGAVMALVGPPLWGYVSDRVGRRMPFIVMGAVLTGVALVWLAYAPSYWQLLLAFVLLQAADDVAAGPYAALIPDRAARLEHGLASGWLGALQALGSILGGLMGFVVVSQQWQLLLIALVNLGAAWLVFRYIGETPGLKPQSVGLVRGLLAPWRNADFTWVWLTRFLMTLAQWMVLFYLQFFVANRVLGWQGLADDAGQAVALLGLVIYVGAIIVSVWAGAHSDRAGRKPTILWAGVGLGLLTVVMLLVPRFELLLLAALVFGLLYGAYLAVSWALAADILPNPMSHGADMGVWQTSSVLPQVLGGLLAGALGAQGAEVGQANYALVFLLAAVCFVLAGVLVGRVRKAK
ncbi:MAG: MFS transporter [Meiothermus sp.]|nr:MFS transporter [Meiothermus sp.]